MKKVILFLCLYALAVAIPLILVSATADAGDKDPMLVEIGNSCALIGLGILLMQPVLAARIRVVERPIGLDAIYRFHRTMGVVAGCLIVTHPVLLAAGSNHWTLLTSFHSHWYILLGKAGYLLLIITVLASLFYAALRMKFETWRALHNVLAIVIIPGGLIHSGFAGELFERPVVLAAWIALAAIVLSVYVWHRVLRPMRLKSRSWTIVEVTPETHNVWTVKFEPPVGSEVPDYLPGQFHFLTFYRHVGPVEEHPFTISSSPTQKGFVTSTIKASGDFTATIGTCTCGSDAAARLGPFGRFSCALHPDEKDLVFIAGGIGMTPFMSMLRWMRDTNFDARVTLIYANRAERDIVFREELDAIAKAGRPALAVTHVLSEPGASWKGERGYVDADKVARLVGKDLAGRTFYLCGPPPMMKSLSAALRRLGVPCGKIRSERFAL